MNNRRSKIQNRSNDAFFNQNYSSSPRTTMNLHSNSASMAPPPPPPPPAKSGGTSIGNSIGKPTTSMPARRPASARPTGNYYPTGDSAPRPAPTFYQTQQPQQAAPAEASADDDWYNNSSSTQPAAATTNVTTNATTPSYYGTSSVATMPSSNAKNYNSTFLNFNNNSGQPPAAPSTSIQEKSTDDAFFSGAMDSSATSNTVKTNVSSSSVTYNDDYDDEPPLMEELGINLQHIQTKSGAVILPFNKNSSIDNSIMEDSDMAGPIFFAFLLGGELLLSGKFQFGYIYGLCMFGCFSLTLMLNLMSLSEPISVWTVTSVLGYALLPVNALAAINILLRVKKLGFFGIFLVALVIIWCTVASTRLFERGCGFRDQRYLIGYPCALFYSAFVMITIF